MNSAITDLIQFLEKSIQKEQDPAELEELRRTLITARKVEQYRRKLLCA